MREINLPVENITVGFTVYGEYLSIPFPAEGLRIILDTLGLQGHSIIGKPNKIVDDEGKTILEFRDDTG